MAEADWGHPDSAALRRCFGRGLRGQRDGKMVHTRVGPRGSHPTRGVPGEIAPRGRCLSTNVSYNMRRVKISCERAAFLLVNARILYRGNQHAPSLLDSMSLFSVKHEVRSFSMSPLCRSALTQTVRPPLLEPCQGRPAGGRLPHRDTIFGALGPGAGAISPGAASGARAEVCGPLPARARCSQKLTARQRAAGVGPL